MSNELRIETFPIEEICRRITNAAMNAARKELENSDGEINQHLKQSGRGLILTSEMKFNLIFTIKPIQSNEQQKSSGEKVRTAQGRKESRPKKIGTKKAGKVKFNRERPNPLD